MDRLQDRHIIGLIQSDPERGFRMLINRYKETVYWHIRRLVVSHDDAEDATQETFIRIFRSAGRFRGSSSLKTWIYRIATNEALRILERRRQGQVAIDTPGTGVNAMPLTNIRTTATWRASDSRRQYGPCLQGSSWYSTCATTMS